MQKLILLVLLSNSFLWCKSQEHDKVWITGGAEVFISTFFNDTVNNSCFIDTFGYNTYYTLGNSNICDSSGDLQFSCDGMNVYGKDHKLMNGGYKLVPNDIYIDDNGFSSYSQSSIILPMSNDIYYIITPTCSDLQHTNWITGVSFHFDLLWYHIIDMKQNNGMGTVVQSKIPILESETFSKLQMMACRHANGRDWWLLKAGYDTVNFYTFLVTDQGIQDYGLQTFPEIDADYGWDVNGQSVFSPDGSMFATVLGHRRTVNLFDFDRCTGQLSNQRVINTPHHTIGNPTDSTELEFMSTTGIAFSMNQKYLYVAGKFNIDQYELSNPDSASAWYHVANLDTTWQNFQGYSNMYLGPDKKLYIGNWSGLSKQMSVINKPDEKGVACEWCPRCMRFNPFWGGATTPPCMPNYHLGVLTGSPCDTIKSVTVPPVVTASEQILIPNAFSPNDDGLNDTWQLLNIPALQLAGVILQSVGVYNRWGNEVFKSNDINFEWNGKGWASDTYYYFIRYRTKDGVSKVQKGSVTVVR